MVSWPKFLRPLEDEPSEAHQEPLIHLTDAARQKLREVLGAKGLAATGALRVSATARPSGSVDFGMSLEEQSHPGPGDSLYEIDGLRVLVDAQSLASVRGATVDFVSDPLRPGFRVEPPAPPAPPPAADRPTLDMSHPLIAAVQQVLEQQVNPGIASHGGRATLIDVKDDVAYVELGGGCQGCSMASVTLKQGVERMIRQAVPRIREVVDTTDHAGGRNPYYQAAKGGSSPFAESAKG